MEVNYDIEVSFSPINYDRLKNEDAIVVIIDVLRATSAICTAFAHGVDRIIPVRSLDEAREYKAQGYLVGAERNGEQLDEFDFGNSPYHYMNPELQGKTVVLTTTNGTLALDMARDAYKVVCGAFANITTLCNWLEEQKRPVLLLCAGWKGRFNLEDALFAGAVVGRLVDKPGFENTADSALAVRYLYDNAKDDPFKFLNNSSHRKRLARLSLKEDIRFCLAMDTAKVIPVLDGKYLVPLK